jgi:acyl-CoA synthetase (AMP-forming)/AMP-acid ligase II
VIRDGWYMTGDIAMMDEDGFIFITDRLSRFSKIGGEMVPHLKIEEAINGVLGDLCSAVTAVPDAPAASGWWRFYTRDGRHAAQDLWARLGETELPQLWIPKREHLVQIGEIPTLGHRQSGLAAPGEMANALAAEPVQTDVPQAAGPAHGSQCKAEEDGRHQRGRNDEEVREADDRHHQVAACKRAGTASISVGSWMPRLATMRPSPP